MAFLPGDPAGTEATVAAGFDGAGVSVVLRGGGALMGDARVVVAVARSAETLVGDVLGVHVRLGV